MNLEPSSQPLDLQRIQSFLAEDIGCEWMLKTSTGSTNRDVLEDYAINKRDVVCVAETQTAGRGRRGRQWISAQSKNIICTIGLKVSIEAEYLGLLSIVTGLALCRSLRNQTGLNVQMKWPNDLLLNNRKLGGILIESQVIAENQFYLAIGFGINVNMEKEAVQAIDPPAISLLAAKGEYFDRDALLAVCVLDVIHNIRHFNSQWIDELMSEFNRFDSFRDQMVEARLAHEVVTGKNCGINRHGQIVIKADDELRYFSAADISLRLNK